MLIDKALYDVLISLVEYQNDECFEKKHPRNVLGQFVKKTSKEEKQKKIDSVIISKDYDTILPKLNEETISQLNIINKQIRLKKDIVEINKKHDDVNKGLDNYIVGKALYDPTTVIPAKTSGYMHFISETNDDNNPTLILDLQDVGDYYDVVHYYFVKNKGVRRIKRNH